MRWEEYKKQIAEKGLSENMYILGIDLGTTNSIVCYWDHHKKAPTPIDVSNGFGKVPLPSVVQFRQDGGGGEWVVGEEAFRNMKIYPETTVRSIKRKMGKDFGARIDGKDYRPEELSAMILRELVAHTQGVNPNAEIAGVVVSVPYDFDDAAKKATMKACELAGLEDKLICLIEEPKAAALNYNFSHTLNAGEKILVFDFGGGTLDITMFHVAGKTDKSIKLQVISEGGEAYHGGDNIDEMLSDLCMKYIRDKTGQDKASIPPENQVEIAIRAREAKERLSGLKSFRIPFTFCIPPFFEQLTRDDFEKLIEPFINKTKKLCQKALREAYTGAVAPEEVDRILLEGGSSQMPWVKSVILDIFHDESKIYRPELPALEISIGATYYAAMKMGLLSQMELESERRAVEFEVTAPHDVGLEVDSGKRKVFFPMIRRGTPYALARKSHVFTLAGDTPEDMTSFSLKILERINKEDTFEECKLIGEVQMNGLPQRPSGKTRLKITLQVEEEGGLVKGSVEDLGGPGFAPSGYNEAFEPNRSEKTVLDA
ncbi:MAG: Hsp70 family protein [Clostridiales bacterium]|nr:Hsp70 family protein [Clostridiales bacterium]